MHIHILGICGTFMGGIACLAAAKGYRVTGQDENVYPPMSTQLEKLGIGLQEGYAAQDIPAEAEVVVIGNALKRGIPAVEYVLNKGLNYQSGPQWLAENLLKNRWVIAVAGTHGKTTTSSMIAWILSYAGLTPGFLIGGIPANFGVSAEWGDDPFFVVEADEYDCAFFDKRSKFVHYRPRTCVLNNLEFDHADIFKDLGEIKKQFHHLVRTVPGNGALIVPQDDVNLGAVLEMGVWSEVILTAAATGWHAKLVVKDGSVFEVYYQNRLQGEVTWPLIGEHNVKNALAAIAASVHAGVLPTVAVEALAQFKSVKRRMEIRGQIRGITVYDDFAHHPTAIDTTIEGLRAKIGGQRLIAILDIRSNTMCLGTHREEFAAALKNADQIYIYRSPKVQWDVAAHLAPLAAKTQIFHDSQAIIDCLTPDLKGNDHVLVMSNGGFDNFHQRLLNTLAAQELIV